LQFAGGALRLLEVGENAQAALIEILPDFGRAYAARRPIEQPHAESLLERLNMRGHHRRRHTEVTRRRCKAAGVNHLGEHGHPG
jgi:hypothetical protein